MEDLKGQIKDIVKQFTKDYVSEVIKESTKKLIKEGYSKKNEELAKALKNRSPEEVERYFSNDPDFNNVFESTVKSTNDASLEKIQEVFKQNFTSYIPPSSIGQSASSIIQFFHKGTVLKILLVGIALIMVYFFSLPASPVLSVSPDPLSYIEGPMIAGESVLHTISISNVQGGTLIWSLSADEPWVTMNPTDGTNSGIVSMRINTADLGIGNHTARITLTSNGGTETGTISVNIVKPPTLSATPSHDFGNKEKGATDSWSFKISNEGTGNLNWNVYSDQSWITLSPASGTNDGYVEVHIDTAELYTGPGSGTITVRSNGGTETGTISVNVVKPPTLSATPSHDFGNKEKGATDSWSFKISNEGTGNLNWNVYSDQSWITLSPASGTNDGYVEVHIDTAELYTGPGSGTITVRSNGGTETGTISVNVVPRKVFDFIAEAPNARWYSGAGQLRWDGSDVDKAGFVKWRDYSPLEDGSSPERVLETHPEWVDNGVIVGYYSLSEAIQNGDLFKAQVGFMRGAGGSVEFSVVCYVGGLDTNDYRSFDAASEYDSGSDGVLRTIYKDMTPAAGLKSCYLKVDALNPSAGQDWAVWIDARIERP